MASLDLVGTTPVRDGVEIVGKGSITKELGPLVLGVFREGEGVVGCGAAEENESSIADVLADFGFGGGGRRCGRAQGAD